MTLFPRQDLRQGLHEVRPGAEQHPPDKIRRGNARRPLHNLESFRSLYESVAVLSATIRCDVVSMYHVLASIMRNPG